MTVFADLLLALSLPFTGPGDALCPDTYAEYRLNWTANIANERNAAGVPTMAFAMSPDGPALPVELKFHDPTSAFLFDHPKVAGTGTGALTLAQRLPTHSSSTRVEMLFNRHVTNLTIGIDDLDTSTRFNAPYVDRLDIGGMAVSSPRVIEPFISQAGNTRAQDEAQRALRDRLGRSTPTEVTPRHNGPFVSESYASLAAIFETPVSYVSLRFGSDPDRFPADRFAPRPGQQDITITDVRFCVPFGSQAGD